MEFLTLFVLLWSGTAFSTIVEKPLKSSGAYQTISFTPIKGNNHPMHLPVVSRHYLYPGQVKKFLKPSSAVDFSEKLSKPVLVPEPEPTVLIEPVISEPFSPKAAAVPVPSGVNSPVAQYEVSHAPELSSRAFHVIKKPLTKQFEHGGKVYVYKSDAGKLPVSTYEVGKAEKKMISEPIRQVFPVPKPVPQAIHVHKQVPQAIHVHKQVPQAIHVHKQVPQATNVYKQVPQATNVYKQVPQATNVLKQVPQATNVYKQVPQAIHVHKQFPQVFIPGNAPVSTYKVGKAETKMVDEPIRHIFHVPKPVSNVKTYNVAGMEADPVPMPESTTAPVKGVNNYYIVKSVPQYPVPAKSFYNKYAHV